MILNVNQENKAYNIYIEYGCIQDIKSKIDINRKILLVTDDGVPFAYLKSVLSQLPFGFYEVIKQGEQNKNLSNYTLLMKRLVKEGFTRNDAIIAIGGGMVGDLAGFVASTYMRGIDFYNIPTTLLACVDSSIGGKTAIDFEDYKNVIGSFYFPKAVFIDTSLLKTLSQRQLSSGLVEAIKMAATSNGQLFNRIYNSFDLESDLDDIIYEALLIKKNIVEKDPYEKNIRKTLNFGHTFGHAIESISNMSYYHGECVGLGMLYLCSDDVKKLIIQVLNKYKLPTLCPYNISELIPYIYHDKKAKGDRIDVVYVDKIGECQIIQMDIRQLENER